MELRDSLVVAATFLAVYTREASNDDVDADCGRVSLATGPSYLSPPLLLLLLGGTSEYAHDLGVAHLEVR